MRRFATLVAGAALASGVCAFDPGAVPPFRGGGALAGKRRCIAACATTTPSMPPSSPSSSSSSSSSSSFSPSAAAPTLGSSAPAERAESVLEAAYAQCEAITKVFAKTFYLGTRLMNLEQKRAVWAIYVWCRRTDDLVDGPRAMMNIPALETDLKAWEQRLYDVWAGRPQDSLDLALLDTKARYPTLDIQPFLDMIKGMTMDIPGELGKDRYETWEELYVYCYRVASTVGLMTLPVMGTAEGYTEEEAKPPAVALGIALQITNILRDVGEDAVRGRIYLPREDMEAFGVTEPQILSGKMDDNYVALMKHLIARARAYYKESDEGIPMLSPESRMAVQAAGDMYSQILNKIEENGYDNFRKRAYTTKMEKFMVLPNTYLKTSRMPLKRSGD